MEQFRKRFEVPPGQQLAGNGYFSQVFLAIDKFAKQEVSIKIVQHGGDPRLRPTGRLLSRIENISHPNLLCYHEHLFVEADTAPNGERGFELFVSELNLGGNLEDFFQKGSNQGEKLQIIGEILDGLAALHDDHIVHGNLKPTNILVQFLPDPHIRLNDFGMAESQSYKDAAIKFPAGSISYLAPEQLLGGKCHNNVDFWALGMIVYELFLGEYLFGAGMSSNSEYAARIKSAALPRIIDQIPEPYRQLVLACLVRDPAQRPQKVATLKKILAREIIWENGKEVKVSTTPPDIQCHTCGVMNAPHEVTCVNCGKALIGPAFLRDYRSNHARAIWTIILFLFCMLPVGFFYYGLHKTMDEGSQGIDVQDKILKVVEFYNNHLKDKDSNDLDEAARNLAKAVIIAFGVFYFVFGGLWSLMQLLWIWRASNNLDRLGSHNRLYHPAILIVVAFVMIFGFAGIVVFPILAIIAIPLSAIIPCLMLQEIWRGSNPTFLVEGNSWKTGKGSLLITVWWIMSIVFPVLVLLPLLPTTLSFVIQIEWFYLTIGILIAYIVLYIAVLVRINYRQSAKYYAWARQGGVVSRRP